MTNLIERKAALVADLEHAETREQVDAIKADIDAVQQLIDTAEEKKNLLDQLNSEKENSMNESIETPKTLGEFAAKNLDLDAVRNGSAKSAGTGFGFKAAGAPDPQLSQQMLETSRVVTDTAVRDLAIRNLFGSEAITGNALKYFILGAKEGTNAPGTVAENGAKPQFHIVEGSDTATLQKIAGWFYETDELLEDNAFLKSAIDARGLYELDSAIEAYLMTTLLDTFGLGAIAQAPTADNIFAAIMQVKKDSGYNADAIVINPTDYQTLRLAKDGAQYIGGGYFYGPYGNGQLELQPRLWGLNTVVSDAVAAGTVVVGAFKQGGSVITKAGAGARIEVVTGDHDDAIYNRVTVVVEERIALAVRAPKAFVKIKAA